MGYKNPRFPALAVTSEIIVTTPFSLTTSLGANLIDNEYNDYNEYDLPQLKDKNTNSMLSLKQSI